MPTIGTLVPIGDSSVGSWTTNSGGTSNLYQQVDETIASENDADYVVAPNDTNASDYSVTFTSTPATFASMRLFNINVAYALSGTPPGSSKDTYGLQARIMNGATVLAAADSGGTFKDVVAGTTTMSTTFLTSGSTAFTYVNTTATKAQWNGGVLTLRQTYTKTGANDAHAIRVSVVELTGFYNPQLSGSAGSFTETGNAATVRPARKLPGSAGTFTETGGSATLTHFPPLAAGSGSFTETGRAATLTRQKKMAAGSGSFTLTGKDATLDYFPTSITTNLVSFYLMDESSGTRSDSVGSNNLTDNNTVGSIVGFAGLSAQFVAASSQSLSHADNTDFSIGDTSFTVGCWCKVADKTADRILVFKGNAGNPEYSLYYSVSADAWRFTVYGGASGTSSTTVTCTQGSPTLNTWNYVMAWHDAVNDQIGIEKDGDEPVNTATHTAGVYDGTGDFIIGADASSHYLEGRIDELGFWRRKLSATERQDLGFANIYSADFITSSGSKSLSGGTGTFSLTGGSATVQATRLLTGSAGTYSVTGGGAAIDTAVQAGTGTFSLTGGSATTRATRLLAASSGTYSVSGGSATMNKGSTLNAAAGSYSVSGGSATTRATRLLSGSAGSFTVTGGSVTEAITMPGGTGTFTLTGGSATTRATRALAASGGTFSETGNAATIRAARLLAASGGSFAVTGGSVTEAIGMPAGTGTFTLTGGSATIRTTRLLSGSAGTYTLSGSATLTKLSVDTLAAGTGSFTVSGSANLRSTRLLAASGGTFTETGNTATVRVNRLLAASSGSFSETGNNASTRLARRVAGAAGSFTSSGSATLTYSAGGGSDPLDVTRGSVLLLA